MLSFLFVDPEFFSKNTFVKICSRIRSALITVMWGGRPDKLKLPQLAETSKYWLPFRWLFDLP